MNIYQAQWDYLQAAWKQKRYPQALLFVGTLDSVLRDFISRFVSSIFCKDKDNRPCNQCVDCNWSAKGEHPDLEWVKPEKNGGPVKIDQIRELQNFSYLTPQRASNHLIIIESAERMNTSAANALLKILEEPAPHTLFLLIAHQLSTVLPTILSRCQVMRFSPAIDLSSMNYLALGEHYPQGSAEAIVMTQAENILEQLIAVVERRQHPCTVAAQYTQFELHSLLWFFYLVYSQLQIMLINKQKHTGLAAKQMNKLVSLFVPVKIFTQIDKINILQRKLSHNMNVNHTLVLEDLLFDL